MRIIFLVLFKLLCINLASLLLFYNRIMLIYAFEDFMKRLKENLQLKLRNENIYKEYESLFGKYSFYYDIGEIIFFFLLLIETGILIIPILFQTCNKYCKICRAITSLLLLVACLFITIYFLIISFKVKNSLNLIDEEIYIFDDEFNKEIKENIKTMHDRKIYLITCRFFEATGIIAQFVLIILDLVNTYSNKNKNQLNIENAQEQNIIVYETERQRNNTEYVDNAKQENLDNKNMASI